MRVCREMQGVKVRLEVGPKEAQEGGCIFSVSSKPGEVATKVAMQVRFRSGTNTGLSQHARYPASLLLKLTPKLLPPF